MNFSENVSEFMTNSIYNPKEKNKELVISFVWLFYEIGLFS